MKIGPFTLTPKGLVMDRKPSPDDWENLGKVLGHIQRNINWWVGDMIVFGEAQQGDDIYQAVSETVSLDYIDRCSYMSRMFPPGTRQPLSFTHHQAVASLKDPIRETLLKTAKENNWTAAELKQVAKEYL